MSLVVDTTTPELRKLVAALKDKSSLNKVMANAGRIVIQDHFATYAQTNRNRFGRPSTFWKRMRQATYAESDSTVAAVVMPREVAQRRFGGTIKPTGGRKNLTIPLDRAAYNKSARTFQDLFVLTLKRGGTERRFLAMKLRKNRIKVLYALRESVTQTGSADVLPSDSKIVDAVREAAVEYIARRTP